MSARKFNIHKPGSYGNVTVQFDITDDGERCIKVLLHGNLIMCIMGTSRTYIMQDCGWATLTTLRTLNTALKQFNNNVWVNQVKGHWYYNDGRTNESVLFQNGKEYRF
jgi:hypothetical protein